MLLDSSTSIELSSVFNTHCQKVTRYQTNSYLSNLKTLKVESVMMWQSKILDYFHKTSEDKCTTLVRRASFYDKAHITEACLFMIKQFLQIKWAEILFYRQKIFTPRECLMSGLWYFSMLKTIRRLSILSLKFPNICFPWWKCWKNSPLIFILYE